LPAFVLGPGQEEGSRRLLVMGPKGAFYAHAAFEGGPGGPYTRGTPGSYEILHNTSIADEAALVGDNARAENAPRPVVVRMRPVGAITRVVPRPASEQPAFAGVGETDADVERALEMGGASLGSEPIVLPLHAAPSDPETDRLTDLLATLGVDATRANLDALRSGISWVTFGRPNARVPVPSPATVHSGVTVLFDHPAFEKASERGYRNTYAAWPGMQAWDELDGEGRAFVRTLLLVCIPPVSAQITYALARRQELQDLGERLLGLSDGPFTQLVRELDAAAIQHGISGVPTEARFPFHAGDPPSDVFAALLRCFGVPVTPLRLDEAKHAFGYLFSSERPKLPPPVGDVWSILIARRAYEQVRARETYAVGCFVVPWAGHTLLQAPLRDLARSIVEKTESGREALRDALVALGVSQAQVITFEAAVGSVACHHWAAIEKEAQQEAAWVG